MRFITTLFICIFVFKVGVSQTLEESSAARSSDVERKYTFTADVKDTYTIRVIGAKGQVTFAPVASREMGVKEALRFSLSTATWKPGTYHIVASSKEGKTVTKKIYIRKRE